MAAAALLAPLVASAADAGALSSSIADRAEALDLRAIGEAANLWPWWLALPLLAVGLLVCGFGSRGPGKRVVVAALAGGVAWQLGGMLPSWLSSASLPWLPAAIFAAVGLVLPSLGAAAGGALVGAWLGTRLGPEERRLYVQLAAGLALGVAAMVAARRIAAIASATAGAIVATVAAIALLPAPVRETLAKYPAAPLLPMVVIAIAGAAFQIARKKRSAVEKPRKPSKKKDEPESEAA
ncbi:hypothetical protein [Vulgatibacter incomptus]|uniref:Membrane protein n=1 Tax=Vulgatibacter incomptus TaxID=1391653 RepID=A0A0K1PD68_9BACT|nr:hypothetical protein [Vulgatibacter incomptus]AKU91465.1 membrane protein [Vulgatibacter incomptus]